MSFRQEIDKELADITDATSRAVENTVVAGWGFVTSRAAVDTGRYRAAWNIAVDRVDNSVPQDKGKPKGHTHGNDLYGYHRQSFDFDILEDIAVYLSNNVSYAKYVDAKFADVSATTRYMQRGLAMRMGRI